MNEIKVVDARGLSCPQPVILTKKALDEGHNELEVLVDTVTSRLNVERFAKSKGYNVKVEEYEDGGFKLHLSKA
ncbi:SirA-like domain-containing protein [Thermovirga lienii DSM 17291]|uniref:SirA-like domain-containing protein n=1 Tax=Thermovirga lienii (strain ATCC BAA-1197 / DSM 17291 / Cas60314) TaxID=580340 RepID=G7V5H0_THELD|nr:sulfurtransferase TusA family protein [Thermovirga lienii]AER65797.1 SirA-like domain-containing protein [Thermovirga lienii DSM 17291]